MSEIKQQLHKINQNSNSLNILREVNNNISERAFHEHTHILFDVRTYLNKTEKKYVEIGGYVGSSAALLLNHPYNTDIVCIDPCTLNPAHYHGTDDQYTTLSRNLENNNPYNRNIKIYKNFSYDKACLDEIEDIDILHIDGNHSYEAVVQDFNLYKDKVNQGGFIIFDDYHDERYSPKVKPAVDFILSQVDKNEYDIIGCLDNYHKLNEDYNFNVYANFILYKK